MARGPAYPYVHLEEAVRLSRQLYEFAKRGSANLTAVLKKWGHSPTSSSAVKIIAALKYYGLIESVVSAAPEQEMIRISDRAFRILVDEQGSSERKKALRDAFLDPKSYKLCWDAWGPDMPESMRSTLIFTHGFNESTVDGFLANYRKSVKFSGLLETGSGNETRQREHDNENKLALKVGDHVQWEHDGILGLPKPLKLVNFSDDQAYGWVEGHATGLPVDELVKVDPPAPAAPPPPAPPARTGAPKGSGMRQEVFALAEGDVTIQFPERISPDSLQDFTDWLAILQRKLKRNVVTNEPPQPPQPSQGSGEE